MTWTAPMTFVDDTVLTAAQLNTHLRDNLLETAPAKALNDGGFFVTVGPNQIEERLWNYDFVLANENTDSSTYIDLNTFGPTFTGTTGTKAIVIVGANILLDATSGNAAMSVEVTGASEVSPSDDNALLFESPGTTGVENQASSAFVLDGLTPGVNTFTCKYKTSTGTGNFRRRELMVLPF